MALGTIKSSDGKRFSIAYKLKVGKKYLKELPLDEKCKDWNVDGLIIYEGKNMYLAFPDGSEGMNSIPYTFIKCLDKGCTFKIDYKPAVLKQGD